jgi:hypothetical protein
MTVGKSNTNSIDQFNPEIKRLFDLLLEASKSRSNEYFPLGPMREVATYYETPQHPEQTYFSFINLTDQVSLAKSMEESWKVSGKEFLPLAKQLSELAFKLREVQGEQSTDLSPFIYTLY